MKNSNINFGDLISKLTEVGNTNTIIFISSYLEKMASEESDFETLKKVIKSIENNRAKDFENEIKKLNKAFDNKISAKDDFSTRKELTLQLLERSKCKNEDFVLEAINEINRTNKKEKIDRIVKSLKNPKEKAIETLVTIVYNIFTSDEYLEVHKGVYKNIPEDHKTLFYNSFILGMELETDHTMLYISYLWKYDMLRSAKRWREFYKPLAENIMEQLVERLSLFAVVTSKGKQNILKNMMSLFVLTLADNAQNENEIKPIVNLAQTTINKIPNFLLSKPLIKQFTSLLKKMPNVVNFETIKEISLGGKAHDQFKKALHYLSADTINEDDKDNIAKILKTKLPPLVLHFYTHVLSTHYTKSLSENQRKDYIMYLDKIFDENQQNVAIRYLICIAVYSINYHGEHGDTESLNLMKKIAKTVMNEHKDSFEIEGKKYYFHVIGVAGRTFIKHEKHKLFINTNPLGFILEGLELAKTNTDKKHYIYCCNELGILGVMALPHITLNIILKIYDDIIVNSETDNFKKEIKDRVKESLVLCLSNTRVRYRAQVDDFLRHEIDNKDFENAVINTKPNISFGNYFSWSSVGLFEKMFIHYPDLGNEIIALFYEALNEKDIEKGISLFINEGFKLMKT